MWHFLEEISSVYYSKDQVNVRPAVIHYNGVNGVLETKGIYQSAYRAHHSAETAHVRIHNDIAHSIDNRQSVLLVLLDLSAAFDTIDHTILLQRLSGYGLSGDVLAWLTSYLCDRTYVVRVKSGVSEADIITTGVPQGTVIGPLLFNAYIAPLTTLLQKHDISHHLYGDDPNCTSISHQPTTHKPSRVWKHAYKTRKHGSVITDSWWMTTSHKPLSSIYQACVHQPR